jgi:hypothetical protein
VLSATPVILAADVNEAGEVGVPLGTDPIQDTITIGAELKALGNVTASVTVSVLAAVI